jgi:hypothetical protein
VYLHARCELLATLPQKERSAFVNDFGRFSPSGECREEYYTRPSNLSSVCMCCAELFDLKMEVCFWEHKVRYAKVGRSYALGDRAPICMLALAANSKAIRPDKG